MKENKQFSKSVNYCLC